MTKANMLSEITNTTVTDEGAENTTRNINKNTTLLIGAHNVSVFNTALTLMEVDKQ